MNTSPVWGWHTQLAACGMHSATAPFQLQNSVSARGFRTDPTPPRNRSGLLSPGAVPPISENLNRAGRLIVRPGAIEKKIAGGGLPSWGARQDVAGLVLDGRQLGASALPTAVLI